MDADEDKIGGMLRRLTRRARDKVERANCPGEETLAVFLHGNLPKEARDEVESH
jgi:hypothetical protein